MCIRDSNSSVNSSAAEEEVVGKGEEQEAETETYNDQSANFEMNGMQYAINIGNSLSEYNKYINMRVQRDGADYVGLWMMSDDDQINVEQTLSLEEAEKMADETVRAMGLDMELAYTDAGYSQRYSESDLSLIHILSCGEKSHTWAAAQWKSGWILTWKAWMAGVM